MNTRPSQDPSLEGAGGGGAGQAAPREFARLAALFGRILIREVDRDFLEQLQASGPRAVLDELGVRVPSSTDDPTIRRLQSEYYQSFLDPRGSQPLVQSLYESGGYDAPCAASLRQIADAGAMEFDAKFARAAVDHFGSILLLWESAAHRRPDLCLRIQQRHLAWALAPLRQLSADGEGFYAQVADAGRQFLHVLLEPFPGPAKESVENTSGTPREFWV